MTLVVAVVVVIVVWKASLPTRNLGSAKVVLIREQPGCDVGDLAVGAADAVLRRCPVRQQRQQIDARHFFFVLLLADGLPVLPCFVPKQVAQLPLSVLPLLRLVPA